MGNASDCCICTQNEYIEKGYLTQKRTTISFQTNDKYEFGQFRTADVTPVSPSAKVQVQAIFKGYNIRKSLSQQQLIDQLIKELEIVNNPPQIQVKEVKLILEKLGPYQPNQIENQPGLRNVGWVKFVDDSYYYGYWNSDIVKEGYGIQYYCDGSIYEGSFYMNLPDGEGRLIRVDGSYYIGQFQEGQAHGNGKFKFADGSSYKGEWKYDKQHGFGIEKSKESHYQGQYVYGEKQGYGVLKQFGLGFYSGQFSENKIQGFGKFTWDNGEEYEGDWKDGEMHGQGTYKYMDGNVYQGHFKHDKRSGTGILKWSDGATVYDGQWKNGKQHGKGRLTIGGRTRTYIWSNGNRKRSSMR